LRLDLDCLLKRFRAEKLLPSTDAVHVVATLKQGSIFGEMALIDGSPRSATARAKTDCELAVIGQETFLYLIHETPFFAMAVMRTLVDRLRRASGA
jgi:CRP/FNR family transcriptional regulator, cyclic AMP receptor protein